MIGNNEMLGNVKVIDDLPFTMKKDIVSRVSGQ